MKFYYHANFIVLLQRQKPGLSPGIYHGRFLRNSRFSVFTYTIRLALTPLGGFSMESITTPLMLMLITIHSAPFSSGFLSGALNTFTTLAVVTLLPLWSVKLYFDMLPRLESNQRRRLIQSQGGHAIRPLGNSPKACYSTLVIRKSGQ